LPNLFPQSLLNGNIGQIFSSPLWGEKVYLPTFCEIYANNLSLFGFLGFPAKLPFWTGFFSMDLKNRLENPKTHTPHLKIPRECRVMLSL
jgi:hypothetical protein